jgi:hypothetical protein
VLGGGCTTFARTFRVLKITLDDLEGGKRAERTPIGVLAIRLVRIVRQRRDLCREELGGHDAVARESQRGEGRGVEPVQGRVLQRAIVEVESINVEEGFHGNLPPVKNAGAAPEGAAPRPAAEANRRDVRD